MMNKLIKYGIFAAAGARVVVVASQPSRRPEGSSLADTPACGKPGCEGLKKRDPRRAGSDTASNESERERWA